MFWDNVVFNPENGPWETIEIMAGFWSLGTCEGRYVVNKNVLGSCDNSERYVNVNRGLNGYSTTHQAPRFVK